MRRIVKNTEPADWLAYRMTPGVSYDAKAYLRQALLAEQGYICAYCMRRIPVTDVASPETSRIEHLLSRENHPNKQLDYSNMVLCCPGAINHQHHCDRSKGSCDITFDLYSDTFIASLSYKSKDGTLQCSNPAHAQQIDNVLNLNHSLLKANRLKALKGVIACLDKKQWAQNEIRRLLELWDNKDPDGQYKEYCGMVVYYLRRKLGQR